MTVFTWPWGKRDQSGLDASARAVTNSRAALDEVDRKGTEVEQVTSSLRDLRTRNHFGELIEHSMRLRGSE